MISCRTRYSPAARLEGRVMLYVPPLKRSCCTHVPSSRLPASSTLNHLALIASNDEQADVSHEARYVIMGPVLCGH